ncbi:MAG: hypothetical protein RR728_09410 [Oscillospiraceae bacterium]
MKKFLYISVMCVLMLSISGCTVARFEPMDEAKQKEENKNMLTTLSQPVDPLEMQAEDLKLEEKLDTNFGITLATYTAAAPQFKTDGAKSTVFTKINEFYTQEFAAFNQDSQRFFNIVKQQTGAKWADVKVALPVQSCAFSYELLKGTDKTIAVLRSYINDDGKGNVINYYFADAFDNETGWKLKFDDIFVKDAPGAREMLLTKISEWCETQKLMYDGLSSLSDDQLLGEIAVDKSELVVCLEPFALSADDGLGRVIRLPMSDFEKFK